MLELQSADAHAARQQQQQAAAAAAGAGCGGGAHALGSAAGAGPQLGGAVGMCGAGARQAATSGAPPARMPSSGGSASAWPAATR
jgi:hypothetical protein